MAEPRTSCADCGASILQRTADRHDGLCVRCHRKASGEYLRSPRPHHYAFAHKYLPATLWQGPRMLLLALFHASEQFREDNIRIRWQLVGEQFKPAERLGDEGLRCTVHRLAKGLQAAVMTLPQALAAVEAHMVAIVHRPAQRHLLFWKTEPVLRYFTLELAFDLETNEAITMFCEWTQDGHLNYGDGPPPNETDFLEAIQRLMTRQGQRNLNLD